MTRDALESFLDHLNAARTPVDVLLDSVAWTPVDRAAYGVDETSGYPFATHSGVLRVGDFEFRCYQLNDGRRVFDADDVAKFFEPSQ